MKSLWVFALSAAVLPVAASAQPLGTISAADPQSMANYLEITGFEPKRDKDNQGDPRITIKVNGYSATIFFYGCDSKTHLGCDSIQLQTSFNRKDPWPAKEAIEVASKWRYAAVYLDKEGDPVVTWDVVTGDGIPSKVFLKSINAFGDTVDEVANMVFPDDGSQNTSE